MSVPFPIIRIELENMRQVLTQGFIDYQNELSKMVNEAIEKTITAQAVTKFIQVKAQEYIQDAIDKSLRSFYTYGPGKDCIDELVKQQLEQMKPLK